MYESVSDFNNDEPGKLLFAAVSYMYMYTCTCACNAIREGREGGRERERSYNDIHNMALIRHPTDPTVSAVTQIHKRTLTTEHINTL